MPVVLGEAARSGWGAAFFARGALAGALAAVDDVAVQHEWLDNMQAMQQGLPVEGEEARQLEEELADVAQHLPDAGQLLYNVLQQQATLLSTAQVEAAAAAAAAPRGAPAAGAAATQQQQGQGVPGSAPVAPSQPVAQQQQQQADPPAPAVAAQAWDPTAEKLPQRQADPNWWLQLPVLHVPQLLYANGSKGLMSVRVGAAGGSGGGSEGGQVLVAFAASKDAEALADCPAQVWRGAGLAWWPLECRSWPALTQAPPPPRPCPPRSAPLAPPPSRSSASLPTSCGGTPRPTAAAWRRCLRARWRCHRA